MTELVISGKIDPLLLAAILVTIAGKIGKTQVEKENLDSERLINFLQEKLRKELEIA
jgi:Glu-tRNA(Gln) amidotransferase subunit E-like FAD-binding protein